MCTRKLSPTQRARQIFISAIVFAVGLFVIDIVVLLYFLSNGISFQDLYEMLINSDLYTIVVAIIFIFYPLGAGIAVASIQNKKMKIKNLKELNKSNKVKYVIFEKDRLNLVYRNPENDKVMFYGEFENMELLINIQDKFYKPILGITIMLTDRHGNKYTTNYFANLMSICKITAYSRFVWNYEYKFVGNGEKFKYKISNIINKIIRNNYRIPLIAYFPFFIGL
jgi:hypothetical protein